MTEKKIGNIRVLITDTPQEMSDEAVKIFTGTIKQNPQAVLGLATGSTPEGLYKRFIEAHKEGLDFSQVRTFNLDEYYPITHTDNQSYWYFMYSKLFDYMNILSTNIHLLNGKTFDAEKECTSYEQKIINAGGIDLQVLGIGNNGHIAFNEPESAFDSRTRKVSLTESTIKANSRFFDSENDVPKEALTMGLGTIMECKQIVLLASGEKKADAVKKALLEAPTENVPASVLQNHPNTIFILDKAAAKGIL